MVGKRDALELVLAGILAGGHVLLEDLPGPGQDADRALASRRRSGSTSGGCSSPPTCCRPTSPARSSTTSARTTSRFRAGPVFTNLLLADEINRTPPKTQAALLEAMQEKQVSVEGVTYRLDPPFHVLATANPIEYEGTYPLPEAQLDRFLLRVSFGYPTADEEWEVLRGGWPAARRRPSSRRWSTPRTLRAMQAALEDVAVEDSIGRYIVDADRGHPRARRQVLVGASPRGSLALLLLARARAVLAGRDYVVPEDVKDVAVPALAHRITLRPEMWLRRVDPAFVVEEVLERDAGAGQRRAARRYARRVRGACRLAQRATRGARRPTRAGERRADAGLGADPGARPGRAAHRRCCWSLGVAARPGRPGGAGRAVRARHRVGAAPPAARGARGPRSAPTTSTWSRAAELDAPACRSPTRDAVGYDLVVVRTLRLALAAARARPTGRTRSPVAARRRGPRSSCAGEALRWGRHPLGPAVAPGSPPATGCWPAARWSAGPRACGSTR